MKRFLLLALLLAVFSLTGCQQAAGDACPVVTNGALSAWVGEAEPITILTDGEDWPWAAVYGAAALGYFEEEGLAVTFDREADGLLCLTALDDVLLRRAGGEDLRVIFTTLEDEDAAWEAGQISESGRQSKEVFSAVVRRMMAAGELTEKPAAAEVYDASFLNQARELLNASQLCRKHGAA